MHLIMGYFLSPVWPVGEEGGGGGEEQKVNLTGFPDPLYMVSYYHSTYSNPLKAIIKVKIASEMPVPHSLGKS